MEAFKAAVSNGCNAVYLGMQRFGARAYSSNFDEELLREAIEYAHIRDVKVYVTMNTIVFEDELKEVRTQLELLNELKVDGVIVQDLAVLRYIVDNFEDMHAHCSTQMGIDDLEGAIICKELGARRVVLARELEIEKIKDIKKNAGIPIEVFIHGALCVSYSGNCLMSGLIGYRSGNRGRCVGSCRKLYEIFDGKTSLGKSYILSTKDLNTLDYINQLKELDSLKIEGRMKEPAYVANVVSTYRKALDGFINDEDRDKLNKTFNRTYTKGYMFHEDKKDITNILKPNNFGYEIGKISGAYKGRYEITLNRVLNQNDIIRIDHEGEDVNLSVVKLYGADGKLINSADKKCYISIKEKLNIGDIVYKTKDYYYYKELENNIEKEFKRFPLDMKVYAYPEAKLVIDASGLGVQYMYEGDETLGEAINKPTTREQVVKQLSKLNDTVFEAGDIEFEEYNAFIPVKMLNSARREIVEGIYRAKIDGKHNRRVQPQTFAPITFEEKRPYLTATVSNKAQYDACIECGIEEVYLENIIRRNQNDYQDMDGKLLIGGYGGIKRYADSNPFITDYSFNVVNSVSCYELYKLGAQRVTLSYEINKKQIKDLITEYCRSNGGYPSLEMIVYGRAPLLVTKYCPMKKMNQCGVCRSKHYEIKDEYGTFPIMSHADCSTTIINGKVLNLLDEMPYIDGIEAFRLNFTIESPAEVIKVIKAAQRKLAGASEETLFNQATDTRGHFNKEII